MIHYQSLLTTRIARFKLEIASVIILVKSILNLTCPFLQLIALSVKLIALTPVALRQSELGIAWTPRGSNLGTLTISSPTSTSGYIRTATRTT